MRLLLLICIATALTHLLAMLPVHWDRALPSWIQSFGGSALLVLLLFPALYFFSFRPLLVQITEREQAEEIMRESEHKYRQLFESLGDAAFLIDVETGRVIDTNREAERLLGQPRGQIVGKRHGTMFPPEKTEEYWRRILEPDEGARIRFEGKVQAADSRLVSVHISSAPLTLFGRNLIISLFRDMTEL